MFPKFSAPLVNAALVCLSFDLSLTNIFVHFVAATGMIKLITGVLHLLIIAVYDLHKDVLMRKKSHFNWSNLIRYIYIYNASELGQINKFCQLCGNSMLNYIVANCKMLSRLCRMCYISWNWQKEKYLNICSPERWCQVFDSFSVHCSQYSTVKEQIIQCP